MKTSRILAVLLFFSVLGLIVYLPGRKMGQVACQFKDRRRGPSSELFIMSSPQPEKRFDFSNG